MANARLSLYASCFLLLIVGCSYMNPPHMDVRSRRYVGTGNPKALPDSVPVTFYSERNAPGGTCEQLGTIAIESSDKHVTMEMVNDELKRQARRMGGQVLIVLEYGFITHFQTVDWSKYAPSNSPGPKGEPPPPPPPPAPSFDQYGARVPPPPPLITTKRESVRKVRVVVARWRTDPPRTGN